MYDFFPLKVQSFLSGSLTLDQVSARMAQAILALKMQLSVPEWLETLWHFNIVTGKVSYCI